MVAFAGRKYAARSTPVLVADSQHTITSFTMVKTSWKRFIDFVSISYFRAF